ncbi:MAG: CpsD/CapB family tyrosine-protein kinase, partial [Fusobacteriaceae bacterium]
MNNKRKIFFKDSENSMMNEALRNIRTNLHFLNEKEVGRTILITSTTPKEGKSTIASNYAMSIAITGKKVLLIDCDIRRPRAHESFGIEFKRGLESILSGEAKVKDVLLKNVEQNLDILPTRNVNHNVTELFLGDKMKSLLAELKDEYNTIVLDTPPLVIAGDAAILSK